MSLIRLIFRNSFNFTILVRISADTIRIVYEMRPCADILSGDLPDNIRIVSGEHWAELERKRADDEQLNRKEADERTVLERQRAEDERRRAEEAESRAHIEESKTRRTTFEEYIRTCHILLSKPLRVQTDKSLSTQGSITNPKNKPCPTLL
jgi:hypothetical protein